MLSWSFPKWRKGWIAHPGHGYNGTSGQASRLLPSPHCHSRTDTPAMQQASMAESPPPAHHYTGKSFSTAAQVVAWVGFYSTASQPEEKRSRERRASVPTHHPYRQHLVFYSLSPPGNTLVSWVKVLTVCLVPLLAHSPSHSLTFLLCR